MIYRWTALVALCWAFTAAAEPREARSPSLEPTCRQITDVADACTLIPEAARMLKPSYEKKKRTDGEAGFKKLGYDVTYVPARAGFLQGTTDVFLVSRPQSNRLFIVITGTEGARDWYENAKVRRFGPVYEDGQFYVPPGHAGFRRGMLNIVRDHVININEYDEGTPDCPPPGTKRSSRVSALTLHLCEHKMPRGPGEVEAVIVGHSRGAGIGMITAAAFAGEEIKRPAGKALGSVDRQEYWPLRLHAIVVFSPPHSVYHMTDREAGVRVPEGIEDQWTVLERVGAIDRTIAFVDERDLVPNLSNGVGRNFGHRYRIDRHGKLQYEGSVWTPDADLAEAHSSHGYCRHVLGIAEGDPAPDCPPARKPMGKKYRRPAQPPTP
jgi:pimeloyl-ACP methyl ester carboxylesterase